MLNSCYTLDLAEDEVKYQRKVTATLPYRLQTLARLRQGSHSFPVYPARMEAARRAGTLFSALLLLGQCPVLTIV